MYVKIVKTCGDCDRWNKEALHCLEWKKGCTEDTPCCHGALTGMIPATLTPTPRWMQAEVDSINMEINSRKEKNPDGNKEEKD